MKGVEGVMAFQIEEQFENEDLSFTGGCDYQLDDKFRMKIPAAFSKGLGDGFAIIKGIGKSLKVITKEEAKKLKQLFRNINPYDLEAQAYKREIAALWDEPKVDSQGRFVLNQRLRQIANINRSMVINGVFDHLEIWAKEEHELRQLYNEKEMNAAMKAIYDTEVNKVKNGI